LYIKYKTMDEFSSLEDNSEMGDMATSEKGTISAGATPLTIDKRASIYEFIHTFEEKKRKKKKAAATPKKDKAIISLSPLTFYINQYCE